MTNLRSPILSLIVPIYNVAPYLRKCVDSLLAQDYDDYEILLVNDGSTDESGAICDEYAASSPIIRVIHQENGGISAARNTGITAAKGQYICFVDSDDFWQTNVLASLITQMEREQLDVLRFDYQNVRIKNEGLKELMNEREYEVFEPNKTPRYIDKCTDIVDGQTYLNTRMGYACYVWQFVIRRTILISNSQSPISNLKSEKEAILFTLGIHFEDVDWLPRMMFKAQRINSTTLVVYNYLAREGSITKTQGNKKKIRENIEDQLIVIQRYLQLVEQYPNCKWLVNMKSLMAVVVLTNVARSFYEERKIFIERMRDMHVFPVTIANQGKTYSRRAKLINLLGPNIYSRIIRMR